MAIELFAGDWGNGMRCSYLRYKALKLHLLVAACTMSGLLSPAHAGSELEDLAIRAGFRILSQGDSSGTAQNQAIAGIPLRGMTPRNRERAEQVIEKCNQFRKLPDLQYSVDVPIYRYLLQHPDVAVSTWRVMGISRFEMWQTGHMEYEARAADGSEGLADILYRDDNQCVFICDGSYHNPLLPKPLQAVALIWFRNYFSPAVDGTQVVTQKADVFVSFSSLGLSTFAKVLTPVTNSLMDRNLFEVSLYASLMSRAVRDEPEWIIQVAQQMDGVLPQRSGELMAIARQPRIVPADSRAVSEKSRDDRKQLLSSGISLFEPPAVQQLRTAPLNSTEALAVGPEIPATPAPQNVTNPVTSPAASASSNITFAASAKNGPPVRTAGSLRTGTSSLPAMEFRNASGNPLQSTDTVAPFNGSPQQLDTVEDTEFLLQPSILPPRKD
ncbi:MAG: hypothetical protein KDA91_07590 [Planctomycetaceae bacterium]|nr:hypothetical protein [Planctomycetaceae bacterium]